MRVPCEFRWCDSIATKWYFCCSPGIVNMLCCSFLLFMPLKWGASDNMRLSNRQCSVFTLKQSRFTLAQVVMDEFTLNKSTQHRKKVRNWKGDKSKNGERNMLQHKSTIRKKEKGAIVTQFRQQTNFMLQQQMYQNWNTNVFKLLLLIQTMRLSCCITVKWFCVVVFLYVPIFFPTHVELLPSNKSLMC